jgi:carbon monoxide dehydrogenase subunit G
MAKLIDHLVSMTIRTNPQIEHAMELTGTVVMEAKRVQVWDALNDAAVLQACIPGCEEVVNESDTVRRARVMIKLGPVRARFNGTLTLSEVVAPERCLMSFEGSGGAAGMASGRSQVELIEEGGQTRVTYTVHASVGGKLGQIGGRLLDASARQLADQFFAALQAHLAPSAEVASVADKALGPVEPPPSLSEPSAASSASSVSSASIQAPTGPPSALRVVSGSPARAAPAAPAELSPLAAEFPRLFWFAMGVVSTGFGVWLGSRLFVS